MSRPIKHDLDVEQLKTLASIQCTMEEIAAVMKCSVDTLERRYAEVIKEGKSHGRASLRRYQWEAAKKGNSALLIWLGKTLLGQREIIEQVQTITTREELTADEKIMKDKLKAALKNLE